jgi:hypothetical protein
MPPFTSQIGLAHKPFLVSPAMLRLLFALRLRSLRPLVGGSSFTLVLERLDALLQERLTWLSLQTLLLLLADWRLACAPAIAR